MKSIIAAATLACVCTAQTAAAQDPRPTFTVGTASAQRGQKAYGVLAVPPRSHAGYVIPLAVLPRARARPGLAGAAGAARPPYTPLHALPMRIDIRQADDRDLALD